MIDDDVCYRMINLLKNMIRFATSQARLSEGSYGGGDILFLQCNLFNKNIERNKNIDAASF